MTQKFYFYLEILRKGNRGFYIFDYVKVTKVWTQIALYGGITEDSSNKLKASGKLSNYGYCGLYVGFLPCKPKPSFKTVREKNIMFF